MMCGENRHSPALEAVLSTAPSRLHDPDTRPLASAIVKMLLAILDQKIKKVGLPFGGVREAHWRAPVSYQEEDDSRADTGEALQPGSCPPGFIATGGRCTPMARGVVKQETCGSVTSRGH